MLYILITGFSIFLNSLKVSLETEEKINSKKVLFVKKTESGFIWLEPHEAEDWYGTFLGEIENCQPHGHGIFISADGLKYIGEWYSSKSGKGTFTWPSGKKYEGEWNHGKEHGQGIVTFSNGDILQGRFKDGIIVGTVNLKWSNGEKYVGEYKYGKCHGKGTITLINGDKYKGEWKQGFREGNGIYFYSNGGDTCDGEWKKGKIHGKGKYTWKDGRKYVGDFKNGEISGKGEKVWPYDVDYSKFREDAVPGLVKSYFGDFLNGVPHGFGTWKYQNGSKFSGNFKNGIKDGYGKLIDKNGSIIHEGNFIEDRLEGKRIVRYRRDGAYFEGEFYHYNDEVSYESDELSVWDLAPDGMGLEAWGEYEYSDDELF